VAVGVGDDAEAVENVQLGLGEGRTGVVRGGGAEAVATARDGHGESNDGDGDSNDGHGHGDSNDGHGHGGDAQKRP